MLRLQMTPRKWWMKGHLHRLPSGPGSWEIRLSFEGGTWSLGWIDMFRFSKSWLRIGPQINAGGGESSQESQAITWLRSQLLRPLAHWLSYFVRSVNITCLPRWADTGDQFLCIAGCEGGTDEMAARIPKALTIRVILDLLFDKRHWDTEITVRQVALVTPATSGELEQLAGSI